MKPQNFVVVEDDILLARQFREILESETFTVKVFHSAEDYLLNCSELPKGLQIYLIDLNLPGIAGLELIKAIRYSDKISPIFIISGDASDTVLSSCLSAGADDYLNRPYNPDHLLLKVSNAQRRLKYMVGSMINFGLKIVPTSRLISRDGQKIKLTKREFAIIEKLLASHEEVVSRETLLKGIVANEITGRTVDVHVSSLRRKLSRLELQIETCRGKGYRMSGLAMKAIAI
jgi:DNA-binding response OmpR family regulator